MHASLVLLRSLLRPLRPGVLDVRARPPTSSRRALPEPDVPDDEARALDTWLFDRDSR